MKKTLLVIISAIILLMFEIPSSASAVEKTKYPESIAGYPVIFAKTPANTIGLKEGEIVLVLLDETPMQDQEVQPPSRQAIGKFLEENKIPENWTLEVVGGPGIDVAAFERMHADSQAKVQIITDLYDFQMNIESRGLKTFAVTRNDGPLYNTIDYIAASVYASPIVGFNQNRWSFMMINGLTNTNYFIQAGQEYRQNGSARNIWTDTDLYTIPQEFVTVPYYQGDNYKFEVGLSVSTWFVAASNLNKGHHSSVYRRNIANGGTYFIHSTDTGVFFENANTISNWWVGFDNPITIRWAWERRNGSMSYWLYESVVILDRNKQIQPNNGKITGSLLNFGLAYWHLNQLLIVE